MAIFIAAAPPRPSRTALRATRLPPAAGSARARIEAETIARLADISDCRIVATAGEDAGLVLATLLARHPHATGLAAGDAAPSSLAAFPGIAARVRLRAADGALPRGADAYVLKGALAMRDDGEALRYLAACRGAIARHARLLLVETTAIHDPRGAVLSWFTPRRSGARLRSVAELSALLRQAGFAPGAILAHPAIDIIEATPD